MKEEVKTTYFPEIELIPEEAAPENPNLSRSGGYSVVTDKHIRTISWDKGYGGTLTLGGSSNVNGLLEVLDADAFVRVRLDNSGIDIINKSPSTSSIRFYDSSETYYGEIGYSEGVGTPTFLLNMTGKASITGVTPTIDFGSLGYESTMVINGAVRVAGALTTTGNLTTADISAEDITASATVTVGTNLNFTGTSSYIYRSGDDIRVNLAGSGQLYLEGNGSLHVDGNSYFYGNLAIHSADTLEVNNISTYAGTDINFNSMNITSVGEINGFSLNNSVIRFGDHQHTQPNADTQLAFVMNAAHTVWELQVYNSSNSGGRTVWALVGAAPTVP